MNTPLKQLDLRTGNCQFFGKCEFNNPTGSHKDRSLGIWIDELLKKGRRDFVISSTGNAAIAAASVATTQPKLKTLTIFLRTQLAITKKKRLKDILQNDSSHKIKVKYSDRPKSDAIKYAAKGGAYHLRSSTDPLAKIGYHSLAQELYQELPDADAIFFPVSSGTSFAGVFDGYQKIKAKKIPAFHAVQTLAVHPLIRTASHSADRSLASAICDRVAHRREEINDILLRTGGRAWVSSEQEIVTHSELLRQQGFPVSPESGLALAAAGRAISVQKEYNKVIVILSGIA